MASLYSIIFISFLSTCVLSGQNLDNDSCVTYNFEANYDALFDNDLGVCQNTMSTWKLSSYSIAGDESPLSLSTKFISPDETLSCISSFFFPLSATGKFEVYVYLDSVVQTDQLTIFVNQVVSTGNDAVMGILTLAPTTTTYVRGWNTLSTTLMGSGSATGYVSTNL